MIKHCYVLGFILIFLLCNAVAQQGTQLPGGINVKDKSNQAEMDKSSILLPGQDINQRIKDNIFVRVEISKKTCFIGEPLLVTYKLCSRLQSKSVVSAPPIFKGCTVVEMTSADQKEEEEHINGRLFRTYILRKVQLIPLQEGVLSLGTTTVDNTVQFFNLAAGTYTPFTKNVQLANDSTSIMVSALPTDTQNHVFSGAIGQFFMVAKVQKTRDTANDNNFLELIITGKGNFMNMVCPQIDWPSNIQAFEPQTSELLDKLSFPVLGEKKFIIPFNCKKEGLAVIPSISFRYFDADTKEYISTETDSIHIDVLPAVPLLDKTKVSEEISNIPYIWIVPAIALVAGLGLLYFSLRRKKVPASKTQETTTEEEVSTEEKVVDYKEKINSSAQIDDEKAFYIEAKQIAVEMLETNITLTESSRADLEQVVSWCNEAMYASVNTSKEAIILILERTI